MPVDRKIAFEELVLRQRDLIWRVCSDYSFSAAWEVEDAFQEVLVALWRSFGQFEGRSAESSWVYRVSTTTMLMLKRKMSNRPQPRVEKVKEEGVVENANGRYLNELIDTLGETDRLIVRAKLDGFSNKEVATMVGLSVESVASRLSRAKQRLRKRYEHGF